MRLTVNGKPREVDPTPDNDGEIPLLDLLEAFEVNPRLVAVAINGDVIPKTDFPATRIREDDAIEIVRMVGGGAS